MMYKGSCHCGQIAFEVEGEIDKVVECNCSFCQRRGYLLWFVSPDKLRLTSTPKLATYTFRKHEVQHHFCGKCGCAPYLTGPGRAVIYTYKDVMMQ